MIKDNDGVLDIVAFFFFRVQQHIAEQHHLFTQQKLTGIQDDTYTWEVGCLHC